MRFISFLFIGWIFLAPASFSQESNLRLFRFFEVYGGIGTSHYFGDIGGARTRLPGFLDRVDNFRDFDLFETRMSGSAGIRYLFNRSFAISGQLSPIWLSGNDAGSVHDTRGWSFNTYLLEGSGQFEYYYLRRASGINPYLLAGLAATLRYTRAYYPNMITNVYNGLSLLGGIGFRYSNNKAWTHMAELTYHYAISDYVEMYNGGTGRNDVYYTLQYKLTHHLTRGTIYNKKGLVRLNVWEQAKYRKHREMSDEELMRRAADAQEMTPRERKRIERYLKRIKKGG